ncbi:DUF1360 domain-containing protein [Peribacillus frigoritolerans]|nr:DUF1360 domain-containing protein [Peribacillus frigoritolerans]
MPKEKGLLGWIGQLLSCFWCVGVWVSLFSGFPLYPTLVYRRRTDINPCRCSSRSDY